MKKVQLFGPALMAILLSFAIMEIVVILVVSSMEIADFKQAVDAHNNGHYTPHLLSDLKIDLESETLETEISADTFWVNVPETLWVSNKLMFAVNLRHCCVCDGRDNNPSWLIRTIWPLFDIKQ